MRRGLWLCRNCRRQVSVTAGTIFQDSHLPLTTWFKAMWYVSETHCRVNVAELQRSLGLKSYKTAWAVVRKLARLMASVLCERLSGAVDVAHMDWMVREKEGTGDNRVWIIVAAERNTFVPWYRRIHVRCLDDLSVASAHQFIADAVEAGSTVCTRKLDVYEGLKGYFHKQVSDESLGNSILGRLEDWLGFCEQGVIATADVFRNTREYMLRFNRCAFGLHAELFRRLVQRSVHEEPAPFDVLTTTESCTASECLTKMGRRNYWFQLTY
jgi:hypothetical protein